MEDNYAQAGCADTFDMDCICSSTFNDIVSPCILSECSDTDIAVAQSVAHLGCMRVVSMLAVNSSKDNELFSVLTED